jgi:glycosyltransferase involved in cell wall biosynthesis
MISVVVLTKDEQRDLPACLRSLAWCDDLHVVDSGSTDQTVAIARHYGAQVSEHAFKSFGQQRNWALEHCALKHPWILFLDADELSTPAFAEALRAAVSAAPEEVAGFYCCWKLIYCERWLKHSDSFPKWQFRLLRRGRARFTDFGHGQKEDRVEGRLAYLSEPYLHYPLSKGLVHWVERHNHYSDSEARARLASPVQWTQMWSRHGSVRNKALKPLVSRLPGWPVIRFLWMYVARLGFLEGRPAFIYCAGIAFYEFLIQAKMYEYRCKHHAGEN